MLAFSNNHGLPHCLNIYHDSDGWTLETVTVNKRFPTLDALLSEMIQDGLATAESAESIKHAVAQKVGCVHFPGRRCRGCEYASDPEQFDPCCLYGHEELLEKVRKKVEQE